MKDVAMNTETASQLGRTAGKLLNDRLAESGILDDFHSRIVATYPKFVQEFHAEDTSDPQMKVLLPMFRETARRYSMYFAYARLAVEASIIFTTIFTKRRWVAFTEGVVGYACGSIGDQLGEVRYHIREDINDYQHAVARLCRHWAPDAAPVVVDATQRIEHIVSEVLEQVTGKSAEEFQRWLRISQMVGSEDV